MKHLLKQITWLFSLLLLCVAPAYGEQAMDQLPAVFSTGLPVAATPEEALPGGAVAYIRLNNALTLLENLDAFAATIVPEKALPAELQETFAKPKPLITFLGMQMTGQPVELAQFSALTGIALDRPISLAIYPMSNGFVLSVPIANSTVASGMIQEMLQPSSITKEQSGDLTYYHIVPGNGDMPDDMYLIASEKTAFFCGSTNILNFLVTANAETSLPTDPIMKEGVAAYQKGDLTIILSPDALKPQIPTGQQQLETFPAQLFTEIRNSLAEIPVADRMLLDTRLRIEFGLQDLDQLVDYAEAYATGINRVLLNWLAQLLTNLHGLVVSLDLDAVYQQLAFAVFSKDILAENMIQPLPLDTLKSALTSLPGEKNALFAIGKQPQGEASPLISAMLTEIEKELAAKSLPTEGFTALKTYLLSQQACPTLASKADWTLRSVIPMSLKTDFSQFATLWAWGKAQTDRLANEPFTHRLMLLPAGVIEPYFKEKAEVTVQNSAQKQTLYESLLTAKPFVNYANSFTAENAGNGVKKLISNDMFTTRRGMFGYQQHELVNRRIMFVKAAGDAELVYTGAADAAQFDAIVNAAYPPLSAAIAKLIDRIPPNASMFGIVRPFRLLPEMFDTLTGLEDVAHRELDAFLAATQKMYDEGGAEEFEQKLLESGLDIPLALEGLFVDDENTLFCTLPGGLHYPRPMVMPVVNDLFADVFAAASSVGGNLSYLTVQSGRVELATVQSTDALALLVKNVTNKFFEKYVNAPDGMQQLQSTFAHPADYQEEGTLLLSNPIWEAVEEEAGDVGDIIEGDEGASGDAELPGDTAGIMQSYSTALGSWMVDNNTYPKYPTVTPIAEVDFSGGAYSGAYYEGSLLDEWGNPIYYLSNAEGSDYMLVSYGENGVPGAGGAEESDDVIYMGGAQVLPGYGNEELSSALLYNVLIFSVKQNAVDFVTAALNAGADPTSSDLGDSAIAIAEQLGFSEIAELLKAASAEVEE